MVKYLSGGKVPTMYWNWATWDYYFNYRDGKGPTPLLVDYPGSNIAGCCGCYQVPTLADFKEANQGITLLVHKEKHTFPETEAYWVDHILLEDGLWLYVKYRKVGQPKFEFKGMSAVPDYRSKLLTSVYNAYCWDCVDHRYTFTYPKPPLVPRYAEIPKQLAGKICIFVSVDGVDAHEWTTHYNTYLKDFQVHHAREAAHNNTYPQKPALLNFHLISFGPKFEVLN